MLGQLGWEWRLSENYQLKDAKLVHARISLVQFVFNLFSKQPQAQKTHYAIVSVRIQFVHDLPAP